MLPDRAASFLQNVIREMFEAQSDRTGPREFDGVVEWQLRIGWDDGEQLTRLVLTASQPVWSDSVGARVRPVVFVAVGSDAQPHPPYGRRPTVSRFQDRPADIPGVPLDELPATPAGGWARALIGRLGGAGARQWEDGWIGFTVTLPDEPPWITGTTRGPHGRPSAPDPGSRA
ncbi:hypothetical protein [Plantactinospora sp. KLBMP9567]|uniref:hypothetical protein n=1 Tax=Plantactinospora sp. KLBMP9567 TaxID=3085900 RepID=UPI0029815985|nr:hypothetical protein [Plantactinospora sp. KLBMP9567]MDW5324991.1 hypothetical protein [Plantactinospora sp. KLBMP9567]